MTKHELTIYDFIKNNKQYKKNGLRKDLLKMWHEVPKLDFIPDAFFIDKKNKTIKLLEVDGDSYTDKTKLKKLLDFFDFVDCHSWFLELKTISLFTGAISTIKDDDFKKLYWDNFWEQKTLEHLKIKKIGAELGVFLKDYESFPQFRVAVMQASLKAA
jgi:hypothetical protein